jgi:hypothetical protein
MTLPGRGLADERDDGLAVDELERAAATGRPV